MFNIFIGNYIYNSVDYWVNYYKNKFGSSNACSKTGRLWKIELPHKQSARTPIAKSSNPYAQKKVSDCVATIKISGHTVTLSKAFVGKVKDIAKKINLEDYNDLLALINSESGFRTTARSGGKRNGAVGLIQFTQSAIDDLNKVYGLNLTKDKIAKMSAMEQLALVEKFLVRTKSFKFGKNEKLSASDLYAIVYMPARAKKSIVATKSDGKCYTQNKGLDRNGDGKITSYELGQRLKDFSVNVNLVA